MPHSPCQHSSIKSSISNQIDNDIVKTFLCGTDSLSETQNTSILNAAREFLIPSTLGVQNFASRNFCEWKNSRNFYILHA